MEIYRYRSMKSLLDFKELENQEIYLAKPEELNDPMEGMYWGFYIGNMDDWNEMFRDYFKYMFDTYMKVYDSDLYFDLDDYRQLSKGFMESECIKDIIRNLAKYDIPYDSEPILFLLNYLVSFHAFYTIAIWYEKKQHKKEKCIEFLEKQLKASERFLNHINGYGVNHLIESNNYEIFFIKDYIKEGWSKFLFEDIACPEASVMFSKCLKSDFLCRYEKSSKGLFRIASFSENKNSASMWGIYANSQDGVCMCFDLKSDRQYKNALKMYDNSYKELKRIEYIDSLKDKSLKYDVFKSRESLKNKDASYQEFCNTWENLYYKKLKDWEFEREWRLVLPDTGNTNLKIRYHFDSLNHITFGQNVSIENIYDVIGIIREKCKEYNRSTFEFYRYSALDDNVKSLIYTIRLD